MNLDDYYWFFESTLSDNEVEQILDYGKSKQLNTAIVGEPFADKKVYTQEEIKNIQKKRKSEITFLNDPWIYNLVNPYVQKANINSGWKFQWDWSEDIQFTRYAEGEYYGWHCDSWTKPLKSENKNIDGKIRKLSMIISLNDSTEYEGGDLEFDFRNYDDCDDEEDRKSRIVKCQALKKKGTVVVFPSFVWHRVTPVTKGTRYSLVSWHLGWPYV